MEQFIITSVFMAGVATGVGATLILLFGFGWKRENAFKPVRYCLKKFDEAKDGDTIPVEDCHCNYCVTKKRIAEVKVRD